MPRRPAVSSAILIVLVACVLAACGSSTGGGATPVAHDAKTGADAGGDVQTDAATADVAADVAGDGAAADTTPGPTALETFVLEQMDAAGVPGLAACVTRAGKVAWCQGFGEYDLDTSAKVTPATLFGATALSHPVVAIALLQLVEQGKLGLDDDVGQHLGFPLRHPKFPDTVITPKMLLAHTAGIADDYDLMAELYVSGDSPVALADFVKDFFSKTGKYYKPTNFTADDPGTAYAYSLYGIALAGYLVEVVAAKPFDQYTQDAILQPLGLAKASWHLAGVDLAQLAVPYVINEANEYEALEWYGFPDYPDGGLYASAEEYARLLLAMQAGGTLEGKQVLQPASVELMTQAAFPDVDDTQGLVWYHLDFDGRAIIGQEGGDSGYGSLAWWEPATGLGVVILTNGDWYLTEDEEDDGAIGEILGRLFEEGPEL